MEIEFINKIINQDKCNENSKPLALTKRFPQNCKNVEISYGWGNVQSGKCIGEKNSGGASLLRGSVSSVL